jgi:hypothetical protein
LNHITLKFEDPLLRTAGESRRYAAYVAWCSSMGILAAPYENWRRELTKITELRDPDRYPAVLARTQ